MLHWSTILSVAFWSVWQCRYVSADFVDIQQHPYHPLPHVSNHAAANWLEKTLWGPHGASQWRQHGLLQAHRLQLRNLKLLHLLPENLNASTQSQPALKAVSATPPLALNSSTQVENPVSLSAESDSDDDDDDDQKDQEEEKSRDADYDDDGEQEDVLSAGLRNAAEEEEQIAEAHRAARKRRAAIRAERRRERHAHAATVHALALKREAAIRDGSAARAAKLADAKAKVRARSGSVVQQINGMLQEVVQELELEKSRCQTYMQTANKEVADSWEISTYDQQREALMTTVLHSSRADSDDIDAQISDMAEELNSHKRRCGADIAKFRSELATLESDTNTTSKLMQASPCKGKALLLECESEGSRKHVIMSRHRGLQQVMAQLSTSTARRSLRRHLHRSIAHRHREIALLQRSHRHRHLRYRRSHRSHHRKDDRRGRCQAMRMDCQVVENAIVLMMADVQDRQHNVKVDMDKTINECDKVTADMTREAEHFEQRKQTIALHVAQVMADKSADAGEVSLRLSEYERLREGLTDVKKECEGSTQAYEKQICGLKQARHEELVNGGVTAAAGDLIDCEVSPWAPVESCSEPCGGGVQRLIRTVVVPPGAKGMACPHLETTRTCNMQSCPVDCKVTEWSAWSACSALCGGGTRSRDRRVLQMAQHGGQICPGENSVAESCNVQACVPDCTLTAWTPWSSCSRACNGGYRERKRYVAAPASGNALCPAEVQRSEFSKCVNNTCPAPAAGESLKCNSAVDLIVVLDGSTIVGAGFDGEKVFVENLFKALNMATSKSQAALILAGGPKTWKAFQKCKMEGSAADALKSCNVDMLLPLTGTEGTATAAVTPLKAPGGPAYTAGALSLAAGQAEQSRPDASTVVLVVGHGRPLSESRTSDEAARLREKGRLMWLVVGGAHADRNPTQGARALSGELASSWASRPYSDNVFQVDDFEAIKSKKVVSDVISAMCSSVQGQ